jgi:hypothetical protein
MAQAAPVTEVKVDADPFGGFNNDFGAMNLGGGNQPPAEDKAGGDMGFDFGGNSNAVDPGTGSGNDIFGDFGGGLNTAQPPQ